MPESAVPPLRVGIMVDGHVVNSWVEQIINKIQSSNYAKIELVIVNGGEAPRREVTGFLNRLKDGWQRGIYNRFRQWDAKYYRRSATLDAFEPKDLSTALDGTPTHTFVPIEGKYTDRFQESDIQQIKSFDLDVVLRFGFRIIRGEILNVAKYGVWSYHHGDNREYRGGPALFWEIYERNPVSGSVLQILTDELDGGRVIYRSHSRTEFNSLFDNRNRVYWKSAEFVPRRLQQLHRYGWQFIESLDTYTDSHAYEKPIYRAPNNFQMSWLLFRRFFAGLRMQGRKFLLRDRDHQWFCAIRRIGETEWHQIPCKRDRFYADPFLVEADGKTFLFLEEFKYAQGRGIILACEVNDDCSVGPFEVALDLDIHLSYPHVFEHEGDIYMTPETAGAGQVRLYRASSFPTKWEQVAILLDDVVAVDPTIHIHEGVFYLFCNIAAKGAEWDDELHIFTAKYLEGPWQPHPLNPVVSNVTCSRPAGRLHSKDGDLIRPSQDCSLRYGYAITVNRIDELSESAYSETQIGKISPEWAANCIGTHMTNQTRKFEVRDGATPFRRWRWES